MACHILGTPNMALRLTAPVSVECVKQEGKGKYTFPKMSGSPLRLPGPRHDAAGQCLLARRPGQAAGDSRACPTGELLGDSDINGSLFIGDKGMVTTGCYGERTRLVPARKDEGLPAAPAGPDPLARPLSRLDPRRKGGEPACSNFSVAGPFVQWMLLGVIAMQFEGKLMWDAEKMRFTNNNEANEF